MSIFNYIWFYTLVLAYIALYVNEITLHTTRLNKHMKTIATGSVIITIIAYVCCRLSDSFTSLWQAPLSAAILLSSALLGCVAKMLLNANNCRAGFRRIVYGVLLVAIVISGIIRPFGL